MVRILAVAAFTVFATQAGATDRVIYPAGHTHELQRIDPAKTLLLIKRIKNAAGGGLVVS